MDQNQKRFNLYVFFSTFARNLIEVFIGTILYKGGFSVHEVIFFYLLVQINGLILCYPCILFAKRFSNKILAFIGIFSFVIVQLLLNTVVLSITYLFIIAFLYALYRRCYWISRRFYNLKVIKKDNIAKSYTIVSVVNQISIIVAAYVGSLLLDFMNIKTLTFVSTIIFLLSVISLYGLKFEHEHNDEKIELFKTMKQIPLSNLYLFGTYELLTVVKFFIPLYIFIYINNSYQTIGILNLVSNVATVIITYLYGKKINDGGNYYKGCIALVVLVYLLKVNVGVKLLFLVSFLEGVFTKMYELSIYKEFYTMSKKFEYYNYNLVYEVTHSVTRTLVVLFVYLFITDLRYMVYFTLVIMMMGILIDFKDIKKKNFKVKK